MAHPSVAEFLKLADKFMRTEEEINQRTEGENEKRKREGELPNPVSRKNPIREPKPNQSFRAP